MDERDIENMNDQAELGLGSEADIVPERRPRRDPYADPDPLHNMPEIWGDEVNVEEAEDAEVVLDEDALLVSSMQGSGEDVPDGSNPLRRFAEGGGSSITSRLSARRSGALVRQAARSRAAKLAAAASIVAFVMWSGASAHNNAQRTQAERFVQADLVMADGFDIADTLARRIKEAGVEAMDGRSDAYQDGVKAGVNVLLDELLAGSSEAPQVQAGILTEILEFRLPTVRMRVEALLNRARAGEPVTYAQVNRLLDALYDPITKVAKTSSQVFKASTIEVLHEGQVQSFPTTISRDARLAAAIIPVLELEQRVLMQFGKELAVEQTAQIIRAESEVLERNERGIRSEVFGASAAFPMLSRARNAASVAPDGSEAFRQGARSAIDAGAKSVEETVLSPTQLRMRAGPSM